MKAQNTLLGIGLMIGASALHAIQDGISRHLAGDYNTLMVVMIRYWFYAAFVIVLALRRPGGPRAAITTRRPLVQLARAGLLVGTTLTIVHSYTVIGLVETHAIFAIGPILIAVLAGPVLGEKVRLSQWLAITAAFGGILVILSPGFSSVALSAEELAGGVAGLVHAAALLPLAAAFTMALYSLLTRLASRDEGSFVSFFWSGILGTVLTTAIGLPLWEPMSGSDWAWMVLYGAGAILASWLLISCYELADAAVVQPFSYLQMVFATLIGIAIFDESLLGTTAIGAAVIVAAGIFTLGQVRRATPTPPGLS